MNPVEILILFLQQHQISNRPLLLGLSGGADSLCLFYALLASQHPFQVAHIDHGWREESAQEALALQQLAARHAIPYHTVRLDPLHATGNLEDWSRQQRYQFFQRVCVQHHLQGLIVGHHGNDQAETILKRVLEGAHWSKYEGLKSFVQFQGLNVWRPFLSLTKEAILKWLESQQIVPFEDCTNSDVRFLRARMRQSIFSWLNREFGKNIYPSLIALGEESSELNQYFQAKLTPILQQMVRGPFGTYLDLQPHFPMASVELKYLIRMFCEENQFLLSKAALATTVALIESQAANRVIQQGQKCLWIDRRRLFFSNPTSYQFENEWTLSPGIHHISNWTLEVQDKPLLNQGKASTWQQGWGGEFWAELPRSEGYRLAPSRSNARYFQKKKTISQWWNEHKVPAFLRSALPVIWKEDAIYLEFMTGKTPVVSEVGSKTDYWSVVLRYKS